MRGGTRGRWDWLRELVQRERAVHVARGGQPARGRRDALRDALARLGLAPDALIDGVAAALGIAPLELCTPTPATVGRVEGEDLATLLPLLLEHASDELRTIGARWLAEPAVLYHVPADASEQWLVGSTDIAERLAARLADEGLAWLGPDALRRLALHGCTPEVRDVATRWVDSFEGASP